MYNRYDFNGATIRALVEKLPAHVFDDMAAEWPDMFEMQPCKVDYVHWEPRYLYDCIEAMLAEYGNYEDLDEMEEDYWVTEYEDGWLVIE